ncbi:MAG: SCO family protein [Maricaulaceae bacterium]|jgi:protein SCO1/2
MFRGMIRTKLVAALLALAATAGCGPAEQAAPADQSASLIGGPFTLTDQTGARVTEADFLGRPMVVFFGYASCPDVCPLSLNKLTVAYDMLESEYGADANEFQTVLITVDPERDTPEILAGYVENPGFPSNLVGLTGNMEEIQAAADAYRVYFNKDESGDTAAQYLVDHTSVIYLMADDGSFYNAFTHASTPAEIAAGLRQYLDDRG